MLWKEFVEKGLDCDDCPLKEDGFCSGGISSYGGELVEPMCNGFDDDTDLDEIVGRAVEWKYKEEIRIEKEIELDREKKRKNEEKRKKRQETEMYCWKENSEIKRLKKKLKQVQKLNSFANTFASAVNTTNEMFGYEERVRPKTELEKEIEELEIKLVEAKESKKEKIKEWHKILKDKALNN